MTIGEAIYTILSGNAGLTAVVPASSIGAINLPKDFKNPCVIYSRSSTIPDTTKEEEYWQQVTYEVDCFASTATQAREIADLCKTALNRYTGAFTGFTIDLIRFEGQDDRNYDPDNETYQVSQGYLVTVKNG